MNAIRPQTVNETPNPQEKVSEPYTVYAEELPQAVHQDRRWVEKERFGAWKEAAQEPEKKFKIDVQTLSPTDPEHCLTLEDAYKQIDEQIKLRARDGFKYLFVRDFLESPWYKRYEILPDGKKRKLPLK